MDASVLDVQIESLKDVSVVLSRAPVSNDGFMFAVNTVDDSFLYYQNGNEILTGQNALETGLTEEALTDGYAGIQTINGTRYHCVSRQFGTSTVICAVADTNIILANDRYVLFWSITGFVLVMIMCLVYAIIVRNDFVRNAVNTDKTYFGNKEGNPLIFDKSIFRKVFPLMMMGVFVIYGISFYTQTLLEISQGIENSKLALDEVTARYEESLKNREVIQNYYNRMFLSKARLISYLLEEDPSALNTESGSYYSVFDEDGNRVYLLDDEGNRLRSSAYSARLQELCDANDLESIYIYNEDGRTIATNTENWYFTISHDPQSQSYAFLEVLDGRKDILIQEAMMNDIGSEGQYVGVRFNYYTSVDEEGNTVYRSQFDREAEGVTEHRSLLQIGLKAELSERLLASTDVSSVLSSDMLYGGFIVLFSGDEAHTCMYSPSEASIGKTAEELGVSAKAFTGLDYYGFARINGVEYFSYFHYTDGYYIGTALPRSNMYQSRTIIALITSLVSLIMILILSGTVTITTKEEEYLYETMSATVTGSGLDSAIFSIILPSGHRSSTVKAAARWDNRHIPWSERSPEQKLMVLLSVIGGILVAYVLVSVFGVDRFFEDNSIIHYILSGDWDRGMNVFALSACALVLIFTAVGIALFRIPVHITTQLLGARGETIGHLLLSVVKYGGSLGALFYCLYLAGMESFNLLASAGLLSLVIGLGAQSLIKDIIAGIFIVFEGEFRVGDIVTINNYRGTVMDIGLRTTKIMAPDGNIKIYNNSEISGVLNMTKETSVASATISIEYGQDIDYVEAVLARELPKLKEKNDKIVDGPTYLGVSGLGDSGVSMTVIARCSEQNVRGMNRFLNKEVLQIFYRNGINVPFPNVTVSQFDMTGRKTMADLPQETEEKKES
ncbi:MAG: mechanosensitive ion channel family protein [Solobacterium sp.]|nr:mechanosensitive ion channel family protein [Solobacterium sp.]